MTEPLFKTCCRHGGFAGHFVEHGGRTGDLYFYLEHGEPYYCLRWSDTDHDYHSGPLFVGRTSFSSSIAAEERVDILNDRLAILYRWYERLSSQPTPLAAIFSGGPPND